MKMSAAKSSQILSHGYDPQTKTLAVRFQAGGLYHYSDVPPEVYEQFAQAPSLGRFMHSTIKGKFAHTKQKERP